ncbi:MAG: putative lactoylglutathione lyase [Candidatus Saccharibacteria bacterium]|nr:putative lactoylglutathione lyase [Candidatus Saccharibacteria bacterium]
MLKNSDVCVTIAVKDMAAADEFYGNVLGLEKGMETPGGTFYTSGSGGVFVYPTQFAGTNQATYAAWRVDDVAAEAEELKGKGVTFEHYEGMPQTTIEGDVHVMGDTKSAWFKDPDGNILNIVSGEM